MSRKRVSLLVEPGCFQGREADLEPPEKSQASATVRGKNKEK
ncbi:MAG: hypothetical protein ACUVR0_09640 [Candidatus Aminicenantales bacterium]